jgi:hypothetical protein
MGPKENIKISIEITVKLKKQYTYIINLTLPVCYQELKCDHGGLWYPLIPPCHDQDILSTCLLFHHWIMMYIDFVPLLSLALLLTYLMKSKIYIVYYINPWWNQLDIIFLLHDIQNRENTLFHEYVIIVYIYI